LDIIEQEGIVKTGLIGLLKRKIKFINQTRY
jgi:hypothetical protein